MPANDISAAFVEQYEAEVFNAYQQGGSKLRNCVRVRSGVVGKSDKFTKIGKGEATQKARHGLVVPMDVDHNQVTATLEDWYAPDYVDVLDEYKIKHDERRALTFAGACAVGRKIDSLIITAALAGLPAGRTVGDAGAPITLDAILNAFALLNIGDVPDDGMRYAVVGPFQWNALLLLDQFAKSDYVGPDGPAWLRGTEAKRWLNIIWTMHTGLPGAVNPAGATDCLLFHRSALGLAEGGVGVTTEISYIPEKVSYLCNNRISAGAVRIDHDGVVNLKAKNTPAAAPAP
jgi:hypothetical protein